MPNVETFGEKIKDISESSMTDLEHYGISDDFKQFIPEGIPQEQMDEYRLLNIIQYDLGYTHEDFEEVRGMGDGPYYSFIHGDDRIISVYEFYRGKYRIMKKIMSINPKIGEIGYESPLAFLDLIRRRRKNPERFENAVKSLKIIDDETENIKDQLREKYRQEQKGFLLNLYNTLLVEKEKAADREKFIVVMTALQTIPYYLYAKEIKPLLSDKNLIEMSRDNVILKDFNGAVETLYEFFRQRGLTDIESLRPGVNHLGWYYEV